MILGVGIDLIEVQRIRGVVERHGERFYQRVLRPDEIAYCRSHRDPFPFIAGRFAAKEAISKAFGTGICSRLGWQDLEVCHRESGQPYVVLHDAAKQLLETLGAEVVHLSLTHTAQHAAAVAVLEGPGV